LNRGKAIGGFEVAFNYQAGVPQSSEVGQPAGSYHLPLGLLLICSSSVAVTVATIFFWWRAFEISLQKKNRGKHKRKDKAEKGCS
jgi:hypothetical protein